MNSIGIDVSKGKSTVAALNNNGEIILEPFDTTHSASDLSKLAAKLKKLKGESKIIMECTGTYHLPVAHALVNAGLRVYAVNSLLIKKFGNNTIRRVKTDKADSLKIASYGITYWNTLTEYSPEEEIRLLLKTHSRQYNKYMEVKTTVKNNFISLIDQTFPGLNELFSSRPRKSDGHQKWIDFAMTFWHCDCVGKLSLKTFTEKYEVWCEKYGYKFAPEKAAEIHAHARSCFPVMPKLKSTYFLVKQAILQLNTISEVSTAMATEATALAMRLPEYNEVIQFRGVGETLAFQIIAEIGNINRFPKKESLVCYAGLEAQPIQSGKMNIESTKVSKKGSPHLRRALFLVMNALIQQAPEDDPIYNFLNKKRNEGKHYYTYMCAGSAKFLRIYYARIKQYLNSSDTE